MSDKKRFSIMEYLNGIYQGDFNQSSLRAGLGVYLWDSGEFYYGKTSIYFIFEISFKQVNGLKII